MGGISGGTVVWHPALPEDDVGLGLLLWLTLIGFGCTCRLDGMLVVLLVQKQWRIPAHCRLKTNAYCIEECSLVL
jgi:hypothetical protein